MRINLRDIPEGGRRFTGEIPGDIFELGDGQPRPSAPVRYDFHAEIAGDSLLVRGNLEAGFELTCVRCLDPMPYVVTLPDVVFVEETGDRATIDLTESIREDILLALPDHPHCEEANPPRICPSEGLFEEPGESEGGKPGTGSENRDLWADLEGFDPGNPESDPR